MLNSRLTIAMRPNSRVTIALASSLNNDCFICWKPRGSNTDICQYCINRFKNFDAAEEGDSDHDIIAAMRIGTKRARDRFMSKLGRKNHDDRP